MPRYELRFAKSGIHNAKTIRFEADDASMALILAHRHAPDRPAELWRDEQRVCSIKRHPVDSSDIWIVGGSADR
jgi:hypothetical protein